MRTTVCLILCCLAQLGCSSVGDYREALPPHPGLGDVLAASPTIVLGDDTVDAEAGFVPPGRRAPEPTPPTHDPTWRGPIQPVPTPALPVPASLAAVELAAFSEHGDLGWGGRVEWEPSPWSARLRAPASDVVDQLRGGLIVEPRTPLGGPNLSPFSQVVAIPSFLLPSSSTLTGVRQAAAGIGCDVVLVLGRRTRLLEGNNGFAALYPLLVGLVLPGSETRAWCRYEVALLDVRSGAVLAVAQGEGDESWAHLAFAGPSADDVRQVEAAALDRALADLRLALARLEEQGRFKARHAEAPR